MQCFRHLAEIDITPPKKINAFLCKLITEKIQGLLDTAFIQTELNDIESRDYRENHMVVA